MTREDPIVIVSAVRTPMGGFLGDFKDVNAATLGAAAVRAAVEQARLRADEVDEAVLGCVLAAGQGQAPARQAVLGAGLARGTPCSTLNKMCGSGMKALMLAHDTLLAGSAGVALAGGMESMSNAPYLLERARSGYRMGHGKVLDHMFLDGLEDAYDKGRLMGTFAEDCAEAYGFTREAQDEFAVASLTRAQQAMRDGRFQAEIVPLTVTAGKTERLVDSDEQPPKARLDKIPTLKPAFREGGTVTAANSSSISDGAAALVLMRLSEAERRGPRAVGGDSWACFVRRRAEPVPHRAGRCGEASDAAYRLVAGRGRPVRGQRSLRRGRHGGNARPRPVPRAPQRPRRRLCAGPSDRRVRRADRRDPAQRPAAVRPGTRRGGGLHRRRRGDRDRRRALALMQAVKKRNPR